VTCQQQVLSAASEHDSEWRNEDWIKTT